MPDTTELPTIPPATRVPKERMRLSSVWIIPIVAAVVGLGIAIQRVLTEGPTITIVFKSAEGVEAGKTFIKYKDVNIGQATAVTLADDYSKVVVTAKMAKQAEGLLVDDTAFWVVQPRVTLSGVSGLGTLLSGNFIGIEVGHSTKKRHEFTGLEVPPVVTIDEPGRQFVLHADSLGSLATGSPLYYRQLNVGQVIGYDLAADGKTVDVKVFVNAPYDRYVTAATRFWNASGFDVSVGANGFDLHVESALALLAGGVAFDTSPFEPTGEPAAANTTFTLYKDRAAAMAQAETLVTHWVLYFTEPIRGLSVGAPVTFLGLPVGEVTKIGIDIEPGTLDVRARAEVAIYPNRLLSRVLQGAEAAELEKSLAERQKLVQRLVEQRGLRAQLRSGNLITGQLYVALGYFPDAPPAKIDWTQQPPQLPVMPSDVAAIEAKLTSILNKLEKLPLDEIGNDARKSLATLNKTLADADAIVQHFNTEVTPEVHATLVEARRTLSADSPLQLDTRSALREVGQAARALRVLADYLERHPGALLFGKGKPAQSEAAPATSQEEPQQ